MARFKKKEFYEHCGVSRSYFHQYVKRGKIFVSQDGMVDTSLPMNQKFMDERVKNAKNVPVEIVPVVSAAAQKVAPVVKSKKMTKADALRLQREEEREARTAEEATQRYNLERQIKEAELEKKEQDIELNKLKIAKLSGEVIPTSLVKDVFAQHFKSVTTAFHQGCDNFIMTIAKVTGMKKEDMARMRGELIDIVNEAVRDGVAESKESVKNIVGEYKEKRGIGERK